MNNPNLGPSAKPLVCTWEKANIWSITVVQRTCRVIDIASLALPQNLENLPRTTLQTIYYQPAEKLKNLPDRDLRER